MRADEETDSIVVPFDEIAAELAKAVAALAAARELVVGSVRGYWPRRLEGADQEAFEMAGRIGRAIGQSDQAVTRALSANAEASAAAARGCPALQSRSQQAAN